MSANVKPRPSSWTVTAVTNGRMPEPNVFGPFDTEDEALRFAELCETHGLPFQAAGPHDVAYVLVTPVYPATLDAVGYYFDLDD